MENIELTFETLQVGHIPSLQSLYRQIFKKTTDSDYFSVKYGLFLNDQTQLSIVAKLENEAIGFFGAISQEYYLEGVRYKFAYTCDYFIQKEYRGKNIFTKLYQEFLLQLKKQGYDYVYAFDSEQTHKFGQKNGWTSLNPMIGYEIKSFPKVVKSILTRTTPKNWTENRLKAELTPHLTDLGSHDFNIKDGAMHYDAKFFKMKYLKNKYFIKLHGCTLWLKYDYRLTVGYFFATPDAEIDKMITSLKIIARNSGIHHVVFHFKPEDTERKKIEAYLTPFQSYKMSNLQISDSAPDFNRFHIELMNGDVF